MLHPREKIVTRKNLSTYQFFLLRLNIKSQDLHNSAASDYYQSTEHEITRFLYHNPLLYSCMSL